MVLEDLLGGDVWLIGREEVILSLLGREVWEDVKELTGEEVGEWFGVTEEVDEGIWVVGVDVGEKSGVMTRRKN